VSCGTRRNEARPRDVRLLKVRDGARAKDPRLDPEALSELQAHLLPQGETLEVTLPHFFDGQELSLALAVARVGCIYSVHAHQQGSRTWLGSNPVRVADEIPIEPVA
jgi:hypothetical protein